MHQTVDRFRKVVRAVPLALDLFIWRPLGVLFFPVDSDEPPVMHVYTRRERLEFIWWWLIFFAPGMLLLLLPMQWINRLVDLPQLLAIVALPAAYLFSRAKQRFLRRVFAGDAEICLACGYALQGLPLEYTCPECGRGYSLHDVKFAWVRYLREISKNDRRWRRVLPKELAVWK